MWMTVTSKTSRKSNHGNKENIDSDDCVVAEKFITQKIDYFKSHPNHLPVRVGEVCTLFPGTPCEFKKT